MTSCLELMIELDFRQWGFFPIQLKILLIYFGLGIDLIQKFDQIKI